MSERSGISFFFMILLGTLAFATHGCKRTIYEERKYEINTQSAAESKLQDYVETNLVAQWKAKSLPQEDIATHLDRVHSTFLQEKSYASYKAEVGETPAPGVFYFFASAGGLAALLFVCYSFFDSRFYRGVCDYWDVKRNAYKDYTKKEIALLDQMRKTQRAIEKA